MNAIKVHDINIFVNIYINIIKTLFSHSRYIQETILDGFSKYPLLIHLFVIRIWNTCLWTLHDIAIHVKLDIVQAPL